MGNITRNQRKNADNPTNNMENPKLIFDRLIQTTVSEALIADAIEMYAETAIQNEAARDEFVQKYGDELYEPIIKKSVLDVVVAVVAAHTVDSDETFLSIIGMLEIEEEEDAIRNMKLTMLAKMIEDATNDMADPSMEQTFQRRMKLTEAAIG